MKGFSRTRATVLALGLLLVGRAVVAQQSDAIDNIVRAEMTRQRIPGMAVAVIRGGAVVKAQGYGLANVEHDVPVTDETIFQSGSVGKQFTAAAVMLQVEDGKIALSDPLIKFFPDGPPVWRDITVRHLLTHTSGIPDYTDGMIEFQRDYTEDDLVKFAQKLPLDFTPGAEWKYSNTGFVLLGAIVRKASGKFYGDVLRERVFQPLGMTGARVISEHDIVPHRAAGYRLEQGTLRNQNWVAPSLNTTADGSLYLSLRDFIAWDRGLRARAILKPESWDAIFTPVTLNSGRRHPYGFGWEVDRIGGQTVERHGGAWQGFKTYIARYLGDEITIVALSNLAQANPGRVVDAVAASLIPKLTAIPNWTIRGAQIADGTGGPLQRADVRIVGDTIAAIGSVTPEPDDRIVDATGLVLAPGFIDAHNHSTGGLDNDPDAITQISQGITTVLLGQDGSSPFPVRDYLAKRRATQTTLNVALLVGHATVRREVMGDDFKRAATAAEVKRMETLVDQEMREGAIGLSSGLEYEVGSYASTEELVALARVAAKHGGFYISHIRDEADRTLEAVREAIAIGEKAKLPVQITHIKLGTVGVWGKAQEVASLIETARKRGVDVTADIYPYLAWSSNLKVLVPNKQWTDPASVKEALDDVGGGHNVQITRLPKFPQYVGKRLDEIAKAEGISEVDLYIRIVADDDAGVIGHTMAEPDMRTFMRQPWTMIASDGGIGTSHPRGAGTFPRVLGRYVREESWLTLPEAIKKMTSMPAARMGVKDRGLVRVGMKADLVIFDPATILDRSTFEQPRLRARGIYRVFVNGQAVWTGDSPDTNRPGRVLGKEITERGQHWPQFRGLQSGVAPDDPRLPDTWSATENVAWKIDIPGRSWSSPVVWGDHVFVVTAINTLQPHQPLNPVGTYLARSLGGPMSGAMISESTDEHRWVLYDIDFATGTIRWERSLHAVVPPQPVHQKNSYASETPVTDGERVYVYLGYVGLFAFDMRGAPVWSKPMAAPKMRTGWGTAASPVLHNGILYIVNDNEERSFVAAYDARTGAPVWRADREGEGSNWATPFVWKNDRRTEIVTTGSKKVRSYDTNGALLWELTGMTSIHAVTPIASHGLLFVSSGYFPDTPRPTYAIRPGASGDISLKAGETSNAFIAWSNPTLAPAYPSPIVVGDQYYTLMDRGFLTSNDPKTGMEIYGRHRMAADSGTFTASPWAYNGKIFSVSEDGDTFVMQAGPQPKLLHRNSLGEMTLASPAVAGGSVFIRTATKLYRITQKSR